MIEGACRGGAAAEISVLQLALQRRRPSPTRRMEILKAVAVLRDRDWTVARRRTMDDPARPAPLPAAIGVFAQGFVFAYARLCAVSG